MSCAEASWKHRKLDRKSKAMRRPTATTYLAGSFLGDESIICSPQKCFFLRASKDWDDMVNQLFFFNCWRGGTYRTYGRISVK